jgi:CheY-like chemotaxis protein
MKQVKNSTILYMDDDSDDVQMLHEAILSLDTTYHLLEAPDGEKGFAKLQQLKDANSLPCLIVMDINMPRMDGRETFVKIKSDNVLSSIPIVIFSTSKSSVDKLFFQDEKVEYITKPLEFMHLIEVAKRLLSYCDN